MWTPEESARIQQIAKDNVPGINWVERVSMRLHLDRLARDGQIRCCENGRYVVSH